GRVDRFRQALPAVAQPHLHDLPATDHEGPGQETRLEDQPACDRERRCLGYLRTGARQARHQRTGGRGGEATGPPALHRLESRFKNMYIEDLRTSCGYDHTENSAARNGESREKSRSTGVFREVYCRRMPLDRQAGGGSLPRLWAFRRLIRTRFWL